MSDLVDRLRAAGCVFAEDEARLLTAAASGRALEELVTRRIAGVPLEHLLGWAEFCGRRIHVEAGVFVPRRRTELLVREAMTRVGSASVVVELCCGTAAVATVLAAALPDADVHAADVDARAAACARRNLSTGVVHLGDLYAALPSALRGRIDLIVANAPYVPTDEVASMPREARDFEAPVALDGGADGLDVQRRVFAEARDWLAPGGWVLVETSERQAPTSVALAAGAGLTASIARASDLDATAIVARAPFGTATVP